MVHFILEPVCVACCRSAHSDWCWRRHLHT